MAGGSRGIGRAVALALAQDGFDVAVGYRANAAAARETAAGVRAAGRRAVAIAGDVAIEPEAVVDGAAEALGGLDALVWCAVEPVRASVLEVERAQLERALAVVATGFVLAARRAAAQMPEGGRIVGLSATGGHRIRNEQYAPLGIAKGALESAVRFLAVALAPQGVTVNAVAPGPTRTEAFDAMAAHAGLAGELAARTPLGRLGEPRDTAALVAWVCSPAAGWVTGQLLVADGGYSLS